MPDGQYRLNTVRRRGADDELSAPAVFEAAVQRRPGWRRTGIVWHGPCPVTGVGTDRCWVKPGHTRPIVLGCRGCGGLGGRLEATAYHEHMVAMFGATPARDDAPRRNRPSHGDRPSPDPRPGRVWTATDPPEGTPGAIYLTDDRHVWLPGVRLPPPVRWLPANRAGALRPRLPDGAVGCLVYRFAGPGKVETGAVQVEAVDADGRRLRFETAGKRPSVAGSTMATGQRVFMAGGDPVRGVHMIEGPLDALALVTLATLGTVPNLAGAAVLGAAGIAGFTLRACHGPGPVTIWPDGDRPGRTAARTLRAALRRTGRPVRIVLVPAGMDWADLVGRARR